ncbi:MAG: hypothetical protein V2I43_21525, partial [Parvularcula sp.]|nr:hypothetical protein [Parvularcula sp.]
ASGESFTVDDAILASFVPGSGEVLVSASASPIDPVVLSQSLLSYPYQCTEQLVSAAIPLLTKENRTTSEERRLREAISTLLERQSADGAFGLWRVGDRQASPWLGAYTADFLTAAKADGLPVPEASLRRAYQALQPVAQGEIGRAYGYDTRLAPPAYTSDTEKWLKERSSAYALYVLTKGEAVDRSRLRYMHDAQLGSIDNPLALGQIGAALAAIGDNGRAQSAFEKASRQLGYTNEGDWYQTPRRDTAGLALYLQESGRTEAAADLLQDLSNDLPEPSALSTQEKAFLVRATRSFGPDEARVSYRGEEVQAALLTDTEDLKEPFTNAESRTVFVTTAAEGLPNSVPPPASARLSVEKAIRLADGGLVDLDTVEQGDRLLVVITLDPERVARSQYVVNDFLPAGLEIETVLGPEDGAPEGVYRQIGELAELDLAEARDDRFVASAILQGGEPITLAYIARAVTPGRFILPGVYAEDMYREDVFARSAAGDIEIAP